MIGQPLLQPIDLEDELERGGFSGEQLALLRMEGHLQSFDEFVRERVTGVEDQKKGIAFGLFSFALTSHTDILVQDYYRGAIQLAGLDHAFAYLHHLSQQGVISYSDPSEAWTSQSLLAAIDDYEERFFFVPREVLNPDFKGVTTVEMEYLLSNPSVLMEYTLAFGLYHSISPMSYWQCISDREYLDREPGRLSEALAGYLAPDKVLPFRKWNLEGFPVRRNSRSYIYANPELSLSSNLS